MKWIALALAGGLAACATPELTDVYRDPGLSKVAFQRVLVVFQNADPGVRRELEDEMARDIPNATQSYRIVPDRPESGELEAVKRRVREAGFDSVVLMRLAGVNRQLSAARGAPSQSPTLWGSWLDGWLVVYEPGYLRTETTVHIATRVYGVAEDKLVWESLSESENPASLRSAIAGTVRANAKAAAAALREMR
ncbi:hypothetical protein BWI17_21840 [Betaproteobacteria bacterium GR16-43]|nr:hypothetical protein BWI17_21840 [Betaproteobacteria bacterium GR16-43]